MTIYELIEYYRNAIPENAAGGLLHIVIDDLNTSDSDIAFCQKQCYNNKDIMGMLICDRLFGCFEEDRVSYITTNRI